MVMTNLYTHQSSNIAKTWGLFGGFLALVIAIGWVFAQAYGNSSILYVAVAFALVMNFVSYWYSDTIVLSLNGAKPASRQEHFDLYTVVENLAITAGLPKPKVYVISDPAPNAFATGRNRDHAVVVATTGLLSTLNRTELEGVIAHELSHIGNRDILVSTVAVVLAGFVAILSNIFMRSMFWGGRSRDRGNYSAILMVIGIALAVLAPIFATLARLAISRRREFLADASGALLTRYPDGLASALEKISASAQPLRRANAATAHLFISNPFGSQRAMTFLAKIFSTHPPIEERIALLRSPK